MKKPGLMLSQSVNLALFALVLFSLLAGCATSSSYSSQTTPIFDKLIVPGERIGPISLGMPQADVLKILGTPPESTIHTDGHSRYYYADLTVFITRDSRVDGIQTALPEYATAEGIRVGMTEPEVRAKLGKPKSVDDKGSSLLWYTYGSVLEICFDRSKGNRIISIMIGE